jgi:membrane-bound ClpP family serine protease
MEKKHYAFGKENFILLAVSVVIIIIGFVVMSGAKTTEETGFDPRIFDTRRIVVAPMITLFGFFVVIYAILKKPKNNNNTESK